METWDPVFFVEVETTGFGVSGGAALSSGGDVGARLAAEDFTGCE